MTIRHIIIFCTTILSVACSCIANPSWIKPTLQLLGNGSLLIEDSAGNVIVDHRSSELFIPASTLKLATSHCALETLPQEFRFRTGVYRDRKNNLYIKGFGDPALTSEELTRLAAQLAHKGLSQVSDIVLDNSYFATNLALDGQGSTLNPYHAKNTALLANYNAIAFRKLSNGRIESTEPQTPLVPLSSHFARGLSAGKYHINISRHPEQALLYVGELLRAFLEQQDIHVSGTVRAGFVPERLKTWHVYESEKTLEDNVRALLKYSNNLIANQLFLFLGVAHYGPPATAEKANSKMQQCMLNHLQTDTFTAVEGAGLSRKNRLSARQLMTFLRHFEKKQDLLPLEKNRFRAKTGTLNKVSTLAGFTTTDDNKTYRFVIMANGDHADYHTKFTVASSMYDALSMR